jgi:hypothetical protein
MPHTVGHGSTRTVVRHTGAFHRIARLAFGFVSLHQFTSQHERRGFTSSQRPPCGFWTIPDDTGCTCKFSDATLNSQDCSRIAKMTVASIMAKRCPIQFRCPPEKASMRNAAADFDGAPLSVLFGASVAPLARCLSGSKRSASSPQLRGDRWIHQTGR